MKVILSLILVLTGAQALVGGSLKVGLVQYDFEGGQRTENVIGKMTRAINEAKSKGAELVILPELTLLDVWPKSVKKSEETKLLKNIATKDSPTAINAMSKLAAKLGIYIMAGSFPVLEKNKVYNSAYIFPPKGEALRQDKVYLTKWERDVGFSKGSSIKTFRLPFATVAILICYDVEFPAISSQLVASKPELILVPSMTETEQGLQRVRWSAQARSIEHYAYTIVVGTTSKPGTVWENHAQSVVLSPQEGDFHGIVSEAKKNIPQVLISELNFDKLRSGRKTSHFYPARDQQKTAQ